jgi:energy-converting hydrogenase Eha subunit H
MEKIFIYLISGIIIAIITFLVYKLLSFFIQKESKIVKELLKLDNGRELITERNKHIKKRIIIVGICFVFGLIALMIMGVILWIKNNESLVI